MNFAPNVARAMAHMLEDRLPGRAEELAVAADIAPPLAQGEDAWMDVLVRADANGALRLAAALTRAAPADRVVGQVRRELDGTRERLRRAALGVAVMGFGVAAGMLLFQGEPPRRPVAADAAAVTEIVAPGTEAPATTLTAPAPDAAPIAAGPAPSPSVAPATPPTTSFGPAAPAPASLGPAAPPPSPTPGAAPTAGPSTVMATAAPAPARVVYGPALPPDWRPATPQVSAAPAAPLWTPPPVAWTPAPSVPVTAPVAAPAAAIATPAAPAPAPAVVAPAPVAAPAPVVAPAP
jgi:hypothetical protein